jgi:photosystem II stability/assembly factor-like uncharacterized protein
MTGIESLSDQSTSWRFVDPGGNGWFTYFGIHPGDGSLYASSDMKLSLFRSRDRGESWDTIANPVSGTAHCIAGDPVSPGTLYMSQVGIAPGTSGLWKSLDHGDSWQLWCPGDQFGGGLDQSALVDPGDPDRLFWATGQDGILASSDGGRSWISMNDGLPATAFKRRRHLNALELETDHTPGQRILYYPSAAGLFAWSAATGRWKLLRSGPCSQVSAGREGVLYGAFPFEGLFLSGDFGGSWKEIGGAQGDGGQSACEPNGCEQNGGLGGAEPLRVLSCRKRPELVYVATTRDRGVYRSVDGGLSFSLITRNRHDTGNNWPLNYRQIEAVSGMIMALDPHDPDTLYMDYNKKTHDGGQTWQHWGTREVAPDRWTGTGLALLTEYVTAFDPKTPGRVWLGFSDTGIKRSEDNGASILGAPSYHRGEVNALAGILGDWVRTSGSCPAIAIDPDRPSTVWATISGKQGHNRSAVGGILVKTVDSGEHWDAITRDQGLPDGIVRAIAVDPDSPIGRRTLYVASYGNGIYKSTDGGASFRPVLTAETGLGRNTRLMDLVLGTQDSRILYAAVGGTTGIRPTHLDAEAWPFLDPSSPGGVYRSGNAGATWSRLDTTMVLPSVQKLAVDPGNDKVVYAAVAADPYFETGPVPKTSGGLYRTSDGGLTWTCLFEAPLDPGYGRGDVVGVVINPLAPEILYIAVQNHGVFGTTDGGSSWYRVDQAGMDRRQRRFHSVNLNSHNLAEVWVAHFGSCFSKVIDPRARDYLEARYAGANLVRNGCFEEVHNIDTSEATEARPGQSRHWKMRQPSLPKGFTPVASVVASPRGGFCLRFHLDTAVLGLPSRLPADEEEARLIAAGLHPEDPGWAADPENRLDLRSWASQELPPYFTFRARERRVRISMEVLANQRRLKDWWLGWAESDEVERQAPELTLYELREHGLHRVVAEARLQEEQLTDGSSRGQWLSAQAEGTVTALARGLVLVIAGTTRQGGPQDVLIDRVELRIAGESTTAATAVPVAGVAYESGQGESR